MRIIITSFLIIFSSISFSQETVFKVPGKVLRTCDKMFEISIEDTSETFQNKSLFLYFKDAIIDTIIKTDSVPTLDSTGMGIVMVEIETKFLSLKSGEIYLIDNNGDLMYKKPLENIKLPVNLRKMTFEIDPVTGKALYFGYNKIYNYENYVSMKNLRFSDDTKDTNNLIMLDIDDINIKTFPYIYIKRKGKWGIIDFEGNIIEKPEYFKIEYGDRGIELYKSKGVLDKIIEL